MLGSGAECTRIDDTTLEIKYGSGYIPEVINLQLTGSGFGPSSTFPRAVLPKFTLTSDTTDDRYQDFVNTWAVNPSGTGGVFSYSWSYSQGSGGPSLSGNFSMFEFKYWEATADETYIINVNQMDEANPRFFYSEDSLPFKVLSSCSTDGCYKVIWTLSNDPGPIPTDCNDNVQLICMGTVSPYMITAEYQPGSTGDQSLFLKPNNFNSPTTNFQDFASNVNCGSSLIFPSVAVNTDAVSTQPSENEFSMSGTVTDMGLNLGTDYSLEWEATNNAGTSFCTNDLTPTCIVPANEVSLNAGSSFTYTLRLFLPCYTAGPWDTATFTTFLYSTPGNSSLMIYIYIYIYNSTREH